MHVKCIRLLNCFMLTFCVGQSPGCDSLFSWQCKSGECIEFAKRCNGKSDCSDGSDETVRECISFQCPDNTFRCTYGACVNTTLECNGVKDCHDNSGISNLLMVTRCELN